MDKNVYTPNFTTHEYFSDVSGSAVIAAGVTLTGKASSSGAADANDVTFTAVSGVESEDTTLSDEGGSFVVMDNQTLSIVEN